ncbi:hypothetical protein CAPTEDRAFT_205516 [Capitella teleta]|uniref:Uncharacterized protein n=1 Tax=Capitella teleta TaxID=283909 RepID=R7VC17_CAPTE|nr:hypothetical protein CAPTEDRAFT_205516 [Capitella teleta]|eukprot:ELU16107.1 hypothetical protein CAPTEDRAFT_205516 [Capitella teleta]
MAKARRKENRKRGSERRDVGGGIIKAEERKRVSLVLGDRVIKAPPSGPVKTKQHSGQVEPVKKAVTIYAYPTKTVAQYKTASHKNKIDNAASKGQKYRTVFTGEYVAPVNTNQHRERDKIHPLGQTREDQTMYKKKLEMTRELNKKAKDESPNISFSLRNNDCIWKYIKDAARNKWRKDLEWSDSEDRDNTKPKESMSGNDYGTAQHNPHPLYEDDLRKRWHSAS